jgi:hypothetical protein
LVAPVSCTLSVTVARLVPTQLAWVRLLQRMPIRELQHGVMVAQEVRESGRMGRHQEARSWVRFPMLHIYLMTD